VGRIKRPRQPLTARSARRPLRGIVVFERYNSCLNDQQSRAGASIFTHASLPSSFGIDSPRMSSSKMPGYHKAQSGVIQFFICRDGQNSFDPTTAFPEGDWRVDLTADHLIDHGPIEPPIIKAGIFYNTSAPCSKHEPTSSRPPPWQGGSANRYAETLAREIKPLSITTTAPVPRNTPPLEEVLWGLVSLVAGLGISARLRQLNILLAVWVWWTTGPYSTLGRELPSDDDQNTRATNLAGRRAFCEGGIRKSALTTHVNLKNAFPGARLGGRAVLVMRDRKRRSFGTRLGGG